MDRDVRKLFWILVLCFVIVTGLNVYKFEQMQGEISDLRLSLAEAKTDYQRGWGRLDQEDAELRSNILNNRRDTVALWLRDVNDDNLDEWKSENQDFNRCDPGYERYRIQHEYPDLYSAQGRARYLVYEYDDGELVLSVDGEVRCANNDGEEVSCVELC